METCAVSDAMDKFDLPNGSLVGLRPLANNSAEISGRVRTATIVSTDEPGMPGLAELLDGLDKGSVLVFGSRTETTASIFGDLAAARAVACGCVAVVSDGWVRDLSALRATGLAVWARGTIPRSGKGRLGVVDVGGPVLVGDTEVYDGDLAYLDETGVCIVPYSQRDHVRDTAEELTRLDASFRDVLGSGGTFAHGVRQTGTL